MSLKRNYETGTKYLYVKVSDVYFSKVSPTNINIQSYEKDTADEDHCEPIGTSQMFVIPHPDTNDTFSITALSTANNNIVKAAYVWLKANIDLFRDFTDC